MKYQSEFTDFLHLTNPWWDNDGFRFAVTDRPDYLKFLTLENKLICSLVGARRVGKTSLLFSLINHFLDRGISQRKIIYLNSDIREVQELGVRNALEHIAKVLKTSFEDQLIVLIDEIQELQDWQKELKLFYDSTNIKFYISGSSGTLLAQKTSKLTGRFSLHRIFPLSLKEYISFKNLQVSQKNRSAIIEEYLKQGGYPEKVDQFMPGYLKEVVDSTLYRDLLEAYGIRQPSVLEDILRLLADKITTPVSSNRIAKDLKIDNERASNYLNYLQAVYLIYPLYRRAGSNRRSRNHPPKYYFNDPGIASALSIRTRSGHLLENAVFIELLRRQRSRADKINLFFEVIEGQEYDFSDGEQLYEVKAELENEDELFDYELKGRFKQALAAPLVIGNDSVGKAIKGHGYQLKFINSFDFLSGL